MRAYPHSTRNTVAVFAMVMTIGSASAETCPFELTPPEPPHMVLGTLVTSQSNVVTFADCGKTLDEVRTEVAEARARQQEEASRLSTGRRPAPVDVIADHAALEELARVHTEMQAATREGPAEDTGQTAGCQVTFANFNKLHDGISYKKAVGVLGCEGQEMSRSAIPGTPTTVLYMWTGDAGWGANMNAMFQGGSLVSKAQMGLK